MSRIRSLHPGQATDEAFASCTPYARLLAILIRCEADDHGVFEWKPLQIKMRLFPGDAITPVDVTGFLQELVATKQVASYEADEKTFGIIRNFGKWQSPRRPTYTFPLPEPGEVPDRFLFKPVKGGNDDGSNGSGSDNGGNVCPSKTDIPDIGGNVVLEGEEKEKEEEHTSCVVDSTVSPGPPKPMQRQAANPTFERFWQAYPSRGESSDPKKPARQRFEALVKRGHDPEAIIAAAQAYRDACRRRGDDGTPKVAQALTWLNQERFEDKPKVSMGAPQGDLGRAWL